MPKRMIIVLAVVVIVIVIAVLATREDPDVVVDEDVAIEYILWDASQLPAYTEVAELFMERNPDIEINIVQMGWGDYWDDLTRRLATDDAPDVWTNHVAFFRDFAERGQMLALDDRIEQSDIIELNAFMPGLADLFVFEGANYGLPKDWDTIAVLYNKEHVAEAGIDREELENLTWNPDDGGSYQEVIQRLTLDVNGNDGLSPGFDRNNTARHGFAEAFDAMSAWGQTQFSLLAKTLDWEFHNETATEFYFDEPEFVSIIEWMRMMTDEGYYLPFEDSESVNELLVAGEVSMVTDGSWMIGFYTDNMGDNVGFAPIPHGPQGRNSMFNGLSDAIWSGTDNPEEAWKWVEFLASPEAQEIVGSYGVVFPAVASATEIALDVYAQRGHDVSAYTDLAFDDEKNHLHPIAANATQIDSIMQDAFERIWLAPADPADELARATAEINALFR